MKSPNNPAVTDVIGRVPYRVALAGGWIDQPFVSQHNPTPPGAMVVVSMEPEFYVMDRAGFATGTRDIALALWSGQLPDRDRADLVRELYAEENRDKPEPSGSQDMIGLIYPGINRLDYDFNLHKGVFPAGVETLQEGAPARWLEERLYVLPIGSRPAGYNPLENKNLDPEWIARLGQTGHDCFDAIRRMDLNALGASMNTCMTCWETLLPGTVRHPAISLDLMGLLRVYQAQYPGAMYSGCGGGYLFVVSERPVPGAFQICVRTSGS